jgi:penicillin-binding protein 1A
VAQVEREMLHLVVTGGTGKAAQVGDEYIWGKTGTTENYGDAWFVGGNDDLTVAIWVGYADKLQPMEYEHAGSPVAGGTFPAEIFHDFMASWLELREQRRLERAANRDDGETTTDGVAPQLPVDPSGIPSTETAPTTTPDTGTEDQGGAGDGGGDGGSQPAPQEPAPAPETPPTPAPAPQEPPPGGGGDGGGAGPGAQG